MWFTYAWDLVPIISLSWQNSKCDPAEAGKFSPGMDKRRGKPRI